MAISGLSRVRIELFELSVAPALAPHPVQMHRKFTCHGYLRDLPSPPHRQVKELTAPLRLTAYCHLRRFHQQEAKQRVALFADVSQAADHCSHSAPVFEVTRCLPSDIIIVDYKPNDVLPDWPGVRIAHDGFPASYLWVYSLAGEWCRCDCCW
jgi:hypothetical protein